MQTRRVMQISKNIIMQTASVLAIISLSIPLHAQNSGAPLPDPTDAECQEIITSMGLENNGGGVAQVNPNPTEPGQGSATPPPIDRTPGATPTPGASPTPGATPAPGATPVPGGNGTGGPAPVATPRPNPPAGGGNIALPTGSAAKCNNGIKMAQSDRASINRALAAKATLQAAAKKHGIDWRLLAAIGVRETNFRVIDSPRPGDPGMGIFQLTNQPGVTRAQAHNLATASDIAARIIAQDMRYLKRKFPRLTPAQLMQATAASFNFGVDDISGNPNTIDKGTTRNNYGENILLLMNCF